MYEHNALGYWSGFALCLTKVRSFAALFETLVMQKGDRVIVFCRYIIKG